MSPAPTASSTVVGRRGRTSAAATVRAIPSTAVATLRQCRVGSWRAIHGRSHPATPKAYLARPGPSTHHPRERAPWTLRARMRNASTSPSNRAPNAETDPVRRATEPSTPSSSNATTARGTRGAGRAPGPGSSATRPATAHARVALVRVTKSAGPARPDRVRVSPAATAALSTAPATLATRAPRAPSLPVRANEVSIRACANVPRTAVCGTPRPDPVQSSTMRALRSEVQARTGSHRAGHTSHRRRGGRHGCRAR